MSGFVQALHAYREGAMSRESLLAEVERQLAEGQVDTVALLKLLNEEHARLRLPDNLHGAIAARILHWREPPPAGADSADPPQGPAPRRPEPLTLGGVLQGRFKLLEPVGQGGTSAVYKAIDLCKVEACSTDPYVSIKLLTLPVSGFGNSLALLQSEARKLQSLPHPNIVRVIDCDRDGRTVFMAMEYLTGGWSSIASDAHRPWRNFCGNSVRGARGRSSICCSRRVLPSSS